MFWFSLMNILLIGRYRILLYQWTVRLGLNLVGFSQRLMQALTSSGFKSFLSVFVLNLVLLSSQMSGKVLFLFQLCLSSVQKFHCTFFFFWITFFYSLSLVLKGKKYMFCEMSSGKQEARHSIGEKKPLKFNLLSNRICIFVIFPTFSAMNVIFEN